MYKSENDFKHAVMDRLKSVGYSCVCIETGSTGVGVPDLFVMGNCGDVWVEFKNIKNRSVRRDQWKIDWRVGQKAWSKLYYRQHGYNKYVLTVCALSDGFIVINMRDNDYSGNIVSVGEGDVSVMGNLVDVVRSIEVELK